MSAKRLFARHAFLSLSFVLVVLLLNRPEVIVIERLGSTVWYPATGVVVALMLMISPWYGLPGGLSVALAGILFYNQPLLSWSGTLGAIAFGAAYAMAACALRGPLQIDPGLTRQRDVVRYVSVTAIAALASTLVGTVCLAADHSIQWSECRQAAAGWFLGDEIGLLGVAPFFMIFVLPWVRRQLSEDLLQSDPSQIRRRIFDIGKVLEAIGQAASLLAVLWLMFGSMLGRFEAFYLCFIPIVWIAMRQGIQRVAAGLLAVNFGIIIALHFSSPTSGLLVKICLLMAVVSTTGLIAGAAVSERQRAELALRGSEAGLKEAQRVARLGSWTLDSKTGQVTWSDELYRMLGLDSSQPAPPYSEQNRIFTPESWALLSAERHNTERTGIPYEVELQTVRTDGSKGWILARGEPLRDAHGNITGLCGIAQDIAERKQSEAELQSKTAFLEAQANSTIDGILVVDDRGQRLMQNQRMLDLFQVPPEILADKNDGPMLAYVSTLVKDTNSFLAEIRRLNNHRSEISHDEIELKDGRILDRYSSPVTDKSGKCYGRIWNFRDITERKRAEQRVQFLAYYDALTGLPNRSLLQDRLERALAAARRREDKVALLFLDLDRFKVINDSLGHSVGDLLLQEVAERLKGWAREQDTVARVGGDEFLIVLTGVTDVSDAAVAAERFMDAMTAEFVVQAHSLNVGCSIGISMFSEDGADCDTLMRKADAAMYSAKESGRNNFRFFTEDLNAQVVERLTLENSLRSALEKREFFLVYQPQMDIATGRTVGLEALLRWRHPEFGLVPPDKFIRIAENSGLIVPIGEWVLSTTCRQARKWQDEGLPAVTVAVNVSAVQFRQEGFCKLIRRVLHETGLAPHYLELELTESILLANADMMLSVVQELKAMGLTLAIDDFGTGYSSFSYLKKFPVGKLKIDHLFVRDVAQNADDAAITAAIISMAKSLKLKVIAEGVENEAQMSFLREHHCDEIQGYYFSKPLAPDEAADKLRGTALQALSASRGV
jgi:diguanylate cyclase (GGDEF)-like protein/PAS domain S-box-containing protein